jgi:hypothetical protein
VTCRCFDGCDCAFLVYATKEQHDAYEQEVFDVARERSARLRAEEQERLRERTLRAHRPVAAMVAARRDR